MHSHSSLDLSSRFVCFGWLFIYLFVCLFVYLFVCLFDYLFVCVIVCLFFMSLSDLSIAVWPAQDWSDMDEGWLYGEWETGPWWAFHNKVL